MLVARRPVFVYSTLLLRVTFYYSAIRVRYWKSESEVFFNSRQDDIIAAEMAFSRRAERTCTAICQRAGRLGSVGRWMPCQDRGL